MVENETQVHAYISRDLRHRLDVCSVAERVSATALIREALEELLSPDRVDAALTQIQEHLSAHRAREQEREGSPE